MAKLVKLNSESPDIILVKDALASLRKCYPGFAEWYNSKIVPNLNKDREVFLATKFGDFAGTMILKSSKEKKKICTLFSTVNNEHIGLDFLRIATEELETYKLPITISDEALDYFVNNNHFNFYEKDVKSGLYKTGISEHIGYIMFRDQDAKNYF